ncbi:pentatricopeptide repeat-containing protein At2g30780-like [Typha angustifolia]|uniref:pentatricopeptide repeat-containing protein At2g30780-like n=1 Tax=Typha angustifolia TaxID=59011 RepID=UPI003C2B9866
MAPMARVLSITRRRFWRQIQTSPSPPSPTANPLLVRLLRQPDLGVKIALEEDSSMARCDSSFWEHIVAALQSSAPRKAQLVLEWKLDKLLKERVLERDPYLKLISFCGGTGNIPFAMRVFTSMEDEGIRPNSCIFNALATACLSSGDFVTALSLFEIMDKMEDCKPNLATYNVFVSAYSKLGNGHGMMSWYLAAKKAGFSPSIETYESLIIGFMKSGKFDVADRFFEEMVSVKIVPNLTILEAKLEGLCKIMKLDGVREFLKFITDGGWELTEAMVEKLLRLYLDLGVVEEMEKLLGFMRHGAHFSVLPRVHCEIIRLHAYSDRLDDMEHAVRRLLEGGMIFTFPEDIEAVICCYFRRKAFNRLDLFLDQIRDSYNLARSTYDLLVAGYRKFELYERLDLLINDMKRAGFAS